MNIGKEMKELIKKEIIRFLIGLKTGDNKEKIDNVINFLKQGWNYEEMYRELIEKVYSQQSKDTDNIKYCDLLKLKRKFFGKKVKK